MGDIDDITLEQVERDIEKCEEFLRQDSFRAQSAGIAGADYRPSTSLPSSPRHRPLGEETWSPNQSYRFQEVPRTPDVLNLDCARSSPEETPREREALVLEEYHPDRADVKQDDNLGPYCALVEENRKLNMDAAVGDQNSKRESADRRQRVKEMLMERRRRLGSREGSDLLSPRSSGDRNIPKNKEADKRDYHCVSGSPPIAGGHFAYDGRNSLDSNELQAGPLEIDPCIWTPLSSARRRGPARSDGGASTSQESDTVELAVRKAIRAVHSGRPGRSASAPRGSRQAQPGGVGPTDPHSRHGRVQNGREHRRRCCSQPRQRPTPAHKEFKLSYMDRKVNRHSKEEVRRRIESENHKDFTFKPQLNKKPKGGKSIEREQRIHQLAQPKIHLWEKCEKVKNKREELDVEQCSFKPKTGRGPEHMQPGQCVSVEDRLFHAYDDRNVVRARLKMQQELSELTECTFKPVTNTQRVKPGRDYKPIHKRVVELQQKKKEKIMKHKQGDCEMTFSPAINHRSVQLASKKEFKEMKENLTFVERLAAGNVENLQGNKSRAAAEDALARDCTFTPMINPLSRKMLYKAHTPNEFLDRQIFYDKKRKERESVKQAELEDKECTFRPDTGNADDVLAASRLAGRLVESAEERVERLAFKDAETRECMIDTLHNEHYRQFTFHPEINPNSKKFGKANTVEDLYRAAKKKPSVEKAKAAAELRFCRECTFKPATSCGDGTCTSPDQRPHAFKASDSGPPVDLLQRAQQYRRRKEQKLTQLRTAQQLREMKDCTFTPEVKHDVPRQEVPVVVRGLGRHMELQQLAQRLREDQAQREARAFKSNPTGAPTQFTIPAPFKLTEARDKAKLEMRRAKVQEALLAQAMKECTFRPKTNAAANKHLIERLLDDDTMSNTSGQCLAIDDH